MAWHDEMDTQAWHCCRYRLHLGDSPWSEAALTALLSCYAVHNSPACLVFANLSHVTDTSMHLLACFSSITHICLDGRVDHNGFLNLTPLQALPCLSKLNLDEGNFCGLGGLQHVTSISARDCEVIFQDKCAFVTSLVSLHVASASLEDFHTNGLSACHHLQELDYREADITTVNQAERACFCQGAFLVPSSMSTLTALTSLHIHYHCACYKTTVQLDWLGQLPSLQSVTLILSVDCMVLPKSVDEMTHLTYLHLSNFAPKGRIRCSFAWSKLVALQQLEVTGSVYFDQGPDQIWLIWLTY